jgi:hypothetical protein
MLEEVSIEEIKALRLTMQQFREWEQSWRDDMAEIGRTIGWQEHQADFKRALDAGHRSIAYHLDRWNMREARRHRGVEPVSAVMQSIAIIAACALYDFDGPNLSAKGYVL